MNYLKTFLWT